LNVNRTLLSICVAGGAALCAADAAASGIVVARFGGEHGHPTTDNATAMYYNPAGLALGFGTRLYIDGNFAWRTVSYTRPAGAIDNVQNAGYEGGHTPAGGGVAANSGEASLANVIASPFIGVTSDFGIKGFGAGLSFYVPIGGQSTWDEGEDDANFPGAKDGVQRWWVIEGTIRSAYLTGAAAYEIPDTRLSIGLSLNYVMHTVNTVRGRNTDGTDNTSNINETLQEGRTVVNVTGKDISIGAGLIYRPTDNWWIGVSYQSQPGFGENKLTGDATIITGNSTADLGTKTPVEFFQSMPDIWRFGARFRPTSNQEFRLFGDYTRWSVMEEQCILNANDPNRNCAAGVGDIGIIPRYWTNAFGVRAGYSRFVNDRFEFIVGAGFDQSAVPDETMDPSLYDANKFTGSVGARFQLFDDKSMALATTYTQVVYLERDISPRGKADGAIESDLSGVGIREEARGPDSAGVYKSAVGVLNINLEYMF
jgi:long-chain fatty acid transport protein